MADLFLTAAVLGTLLILLASGIWIGAAMLATGLVAFLFTSAPAGSLLASSVWEASWGWALTAMPLFVWMGEILFRTKLSESMFHGLAPWLERIPGRLLHVNILGCGVMAAICGSSAVTCATIGRISIPELKRRGYDEGMAIGTLAGSGTLGLLIPPSIMMIVYGVTAQVSISELFFAGFLPGAMVIGLFMAYTAGWALLNPGRVPVSDRSFTFVQKLRASQKLIPVALLIAVVVASIYSGVATPTEAAALGIVGALGLAIATRTLARDMLIDSLLATVRTSCMIGFLLSGAAFVTVAMGFTGLPQTLAAWVDGFALSQGQFIIAMTMLFVILGCFLDGISMLVLTAPVVLPMARAQGIDLLWFGIYIVLVVEMAQITPPVGFNLYVLQSLTGKNIARVTMATFPFFFLLCIGVLLIWYFPGIVSVLPASMRG
ncbi:TRAP transporter large permease subunit [Aminobacter sp. AP02]|uniref:TRAP transporter large permease n=1 Tax=Aminobacter sp. AP02 TaxID=2135737 RepID=UPI000D6CCB8B|nr:TRAP transporter large permease subunit [Aminobacter sp. AP02]PWK60362.1 tripartite ATP-independent transporter DctM subunit [Aminobacter sp. AP02]